MSDKVDLLIGKVGVRFFKTYSATQEYLKLDIVPDANRNWFAAKQGSVASPMIGQALPTVSSTGTATASDYWEMVLWVGDVLKSRDDAIDAAAKALAAMANANDSADYADNKAALADSAAVNANGVAATASALVDSCRAMLSELNAALETQKVATTAAEQAAKAAQEAAKPKADIAARPASMGVVFPSKVSEGTNPVVEVTMQPDTANTSKVFQAWSGCKVTPDGIVVPDGVGTAVFYVVSTINSSLFKKVEIEVVASSNILDENGEAITDENGNPITD